MQSMGEKNRARLEKCVGCSKVGPLGRNTKGREGPWGCGRKVVVKMGDRGASLREQVLEPTSPQIHRGTQSSHREKQDHPTRRRGLHSLVHSPTVAS